MNSSVEAVTSAVSKEQGLSFKSGKLFARRTIPGSAGLQTKELSWSVKDHDGSHLSSRPADLTQANRLIQRGKAIRDLQALLTSTVALGTNAIDVQKAFNLVYWAVPAVERTVIAYLPRLSDQVCNKATGHPLDGFSGCRASAVWSGLPVPLRQAVVHWLNGKYCRVRSGRSHEYQLVPMEAVEPAHLQQQVHAFRSLPQLIQEFNHLESSVSQGGQPSLIGNKSNTGRLSTPSTDQTELASLPPGDVSATAHAQMVQPVSFSHLELNTTLNDHDLALCELFILNPEPRPVQLPVKQEQRPPSQHGTGSLASVVQEHVIRCHLYGAGVTAAPSQLEEGFLCIQEKLDMTQIQVIQNTEDVLRLEGHAGPSLLLDMRLGTTYFPTMAELLIAAKALWMALQQALPQRRWFHGAVGFTMLLNDHLAIVRKPDQDRTCFQRVLRQSVPKIISAKPFGDRIGVCGVNLRDSTVYSGILPGIFKGYPLEVHPGEHASDSARVVWLRIPESLQSVTGVNILLEACNGHYKSVQRPVSLAQQTACGAAHGRRGQLEAVLKRIRSDRHALHGNLDLAALLPEDLDEQLPQPSGNFTMLQAAAARQDPEGSQRGGMQAELPGGHKCGVCDIGTLAADSCFCVSCVKAVHQACAKQELPLLEGFGWFCSKCEKQATLRGAILMVLGKLGRKGATHRQLKQKVERYRRGVANSSGQYGLGGDAVNLGSQLAWMVDGQDGKAIGLPPLVEKIAHVDRHKIKFRLAVNEWPEQARTQTVQGTEGTDVDDSVMLEATEPSEQPDGACSPRSNAATDAEDDDSDGLSQESRLYQAKLDRLKCFVCEKTEGEDTFLLCDSCSRGYHTECVNQEFPTSRFWWCPECTRHGLTIKGLIIQVVEAAGSNGLTSTEITEKVTSRRRDCYPHSVRGERSRLANGVTGRMIDGNPLLECFGDPARYRLSPDPDFAQASIARRDENAAAAMQSSDSHPASLDVAHDGKASPEVGKRWIPPILIAAMNQISSATAARHCSPANARPSMATAASRHTSPSPSPDLPRHTPTSLAASHIPSASASAPAVTPAAAKPARQGGPFALGAPADNYAIARVQRPPVPTIRTAGEALSSVSPGRRHESDAAMPDSYQHPADVFRPVAEPAMQADLHKSGGVPGGTSGKGAMARPGDDSVLRGLHASLGQVLHASAGKHRKPPEGLNLKHKLAASPASPLSAGVSQESDGLSSLAVKLARAVKSTRPRSEGPQQRSLSTLGSSEPQPPAISQVSLPRPPSVARSGSNFDPAWRLLERMAAKPAAGSSSQTQSWRYGQSLADLPVEQGTVNQSTAAKPSEGGGNGKQVHQWRATPSTDDDQPMAKRSRNSKQIVSDSDGEGVKEAVGAETGASDMPRATDDPRLTMNEKRQTMLPLHLPTSRVTVTDLGKLHRLDQKSFWGQSGLHPYPVGYTATKDVLNLSRRCERWTLTVAVVNDAPLFKVTNGHGYTYRAPAMPTAESISSGLPDANAFGFIEVLTPDVVASMPIADDLAMSQALQRDTVKQHPTVHDFMTNAEISQADTNEDTKSEHGKAVSNKGDESTASGLRPEEDDEQGQEVFHRSAVAQAEEEVMLQNERQKAATLQGSVGATDAAAVETAGMHSGRQSELLGVMQRVRNSDAANAPLDDLEEVIVELLSALPETELLEGDFRGWMLAMSLKDDPDQQLRIRGIFADIQYLVKHIPNAQAGSLQTLLHAFLEGPQT